MNKKGLINEIYIVIILFIAVLTIAGLFWIAGIAGPIVVGEGKEATSIISSSFSNTQSNDSLTNATAVATNTANQWLGLVEGAVYLFFFGLFGGFLAVCYYIRTYKWLGIVWMMLMVSLVLISGILSNAYQDTKAINGDLAEFYNTWGTNDFILNYLPVVMGGFLVISGILLFAIVAIGNDEVTEDIE